MMRIRGLCIQGPRGSFYGFLDTIDWEVGDVSGMPENARQMGVRSFLTIATADLPGITTGTPLTVAGESYRVWSQPVRENDGQTTRIYLTRST